jgi:hypothetical protein
MAKLVVLSEGQRGRSHELSADKTTIGRLDDNTFQIAEQSVSSHHCEVLQRGTEVVVKDLNSTNGTFINGEQIAEKTLKPWQVLRLGQIELRLEDGQQPPPAPPAKPATQTRDLPQGGVKLGEGSHSSASAFDKNSPFAKKSNKTALIFITIGAILFAAIVISLVLAFSSMK